MPPLDRDLVLSLYERVGHQDDGEIDFGDTALLLAALE